MAKKMAEAKFQMMLIPGMTDTLAMSLYQSGFNTVRELAGIDSSFVAEVPGFDEERAANIVASARKLIESGDLDKALAAAAAPAPTAEGGSPEAGGLDNLEAKLRAEVAAMEKTREAKK
jgi:N utilization substance protein A